LASRHSTISPSIQILPSRSAIEGGAIMRFPFVVPGANRAF
jgi:hypothetical protein